MSRQSTKVGLDLGSVVHFVFGLLAALLGQSALFTVIFLVKQLGDGLFLREDWAETSGDIAEYTMGLVVGLFVAKFF